MQRTERTWMNEERMQHPRTDASDHSSEQPDSLGEKILSMRRSEIMSPIHRRTRDPPTRHLRLSQLYLAKLVACGALVELFLP